MAGDVEEIDADEREEVLERVGAIDVAKASGKVCVRIPGAKRRITRVWDVAATTGAIMALADELAELRVERVVLEATSDYWRAFYYLLEARGLTVWLVNARDVKNVPGRPKTDKLDAIWLAKLNERGMLRPSFVPPREIRELRDYTRLRTDLTEERSRHVQRVEKLLEDSLIKLSSVATDIMGRSGRAMLEALIAGERDPDVLAELALGRMRPKRAALREALTGRFDDHHAELCRMLLDEIDAASEKIDRLTARVSELIAEVGLHMSQFPTDAHLVSWAKISPRTIQSGPRSRSGGTGKGNPYLKRALAEAASAAARTDTFLGARYRRIVRRRGRQRALVAIMRSILVIVWHLLDDPNARFADLGPDFYERRVDKDRRTRDLVRQLMALGHEVSLSSAA